VRYMIVVNLEGVYTQPDGELNLSAMQEQLFASMKEPLASASIDLQVIEVHPLRHRVVRDED
jgi:hypothetical protein